MVVERAFGHLKNRWGILKNPFSATIQNSVYIIWACCILHNIIIKHQEPLGLAEWEKLQSEQEAHEARVRNAARRAANQPPPVYDAGQPRDNIDAELAPGKQVRET